MEFHTPDEALGMAGCERKLESFDWALVTGMLATIQGRPTLLRLRVEFGSGAKPAPRSRLNCGIVALTEEVLPGRVVAGALRTETPLIVGGTEQLLQLDHWKAYSPVEHMPWFHEFRPCYRLERQLPECRKLESSPDAGFISSELTSLPVASPEACFFDILSAQRAWFQLPSTPSRNDIWRGACEVIIPAGPGNIEALDVLPDKRFQVTLTAGILPESLRAVLTEPGMREHLIGTINERTVTFDRLPTDTFRIYVFNGSKLVAHYKGSMHVGVRYPQVVSTSADAERMISAGESDICELKEFDCLPEEWDEKTWHKVLRTIAGFANTKGGTLFVGVKDDTTVVGMQLGEHRPDEERVSRIIREKCYANLSRAPSIGATFHEVRGKTVLRIDVAKNHGGAPFQKDRQVLIRAGSSTRAAFPEEIRDLFSRQ